MKDSNKDNDQQVKGLIILVAVALAVILLFVGKYMFPDVDGMVKQIVKINNDAFSQFSDPDIISARSYREGDVGVILEYTYSKRRSAKGIDPETKKLELIEQFKKQDLELFLTYGIYFVVLYKDYKGKELLRVEISPEELAN